jgi:hypothetical protein
MGKTLLIPILIIIVGGCVVFYIGHNQDKQIIKNYNNKFGIDTPRYYKDYVRESLVYKKNHKH